MCCGCGGTGFSVTCGVFVCVLAKVHALSPANAPRVLSHTPHTLSCQTTHTLTTLSPPNPLTKCKQTNQQILKNIKGAVDARVSIAHSATILANALMHAGTSIDTFLRENLEWLSRATNWAKFSATAGLGVIHRGQLQQGEWECVVVE